MGFTKNKAWSITAAVILIIVFNVTMFILPLEHTVTFWMGYSFELFSCIFLLATSLVLLSSPHINDKFHKLPVLSVGWIYFAVQTFVSIKQMTSPEFPYFLGITTDIILAALTSIILIFTFAAGREVKDTEDKINKKVFYIKNLRSELQSLNANDNKSAEALRKLAEKVRFSDPMSHSNLSDIEIKITNKLDILKDCLDNEAMTIAVCSDMEQLLDERNKKCRLLKNVPEPKNEKDNSGLGIISVTFGIISTALLVFMLSYFVFIPSSKYNNALKLYTEQNYDAALNEFEKLGAYKDSVYKIAEIKEKITEEKYMSAEAFYKSLSYIDALKLYEELGDYKDSKDKAEQIHNKFTNSGELYFGTYKGEAILWTILKTESDKMLLITKDCAENISFNDEVKNVTYEDSTLRKWLNSDFIKDFSESQRERILKSPENSDDEIFILNKEEYKNYSKNLSFKTNSDWWLNTKTSDGMMCVYGQSGKINETGESVVKAIGVRPCVWINLN